MNHSTDGRLVQELVALLEAHRRAFRQARTYRRVVALVLAQVCAFGRHTITQLLLVLGLGEADWSAWYRLFSQGRYEEAALAGGLLGEVLREAPPSGPVVVGVDGVQIPRSSLTMPGTSWLKAPRTPAWKPGIHRAQRYVHLAWLLPREQGYSRALPLRWLSAFAEKARPAAEAARTEWAAALAGLRWLRQQLDAAGRQAQRVLVVADGSYDCVEWWRGLPAGVVALVRTAKNRVLYDVPPPYAGQGRRRKYGARLASPQAMLRRKAGWQQTELLVRGRPITTRYQVIGPVLRERAAEVPLFLLVVAGQDRHRARRRRRCQPVFYLVSAVVGASGWHLPLPAEELLAWAWQRWELEVTHRELKTTWGIGQTQCWNPRATVAAVQFAVWSYALLLLAGYRTWHRCHGPAVPSAWWRGARRWSFMTLWRGFRAALWSRPDFRPVWPPSGDNWPEKAAWLRALPNAIHATTKG